MKTIALVCCRGGSKGIPGKNIREFAGKPMLSWILAAAQQADVFDDVIVSTDAPDIADVARQSGATVPGLRPAELATDTADQFDTHRYIFDKLGIGDAGYRACILNNNPFITADLIHRGARAAAADDYSHLVLDAVPVDGDYLYYRQSRLVDGLLHLQFPDDMMASGINRQGNDPLFTTMNNMRFGRPGMLADYATYKHLLLAGVIPVWLPKTRNFDIDTEEDWQIAEAVFVKLAENGA